MVHNRRFLASVWHISVIHCLPPVISLIQWLAPVIFVILCFTNLFIFTPFFSPQFHGIHLVVVTVLSHHYNSRMDSGEAKVKSHSETQPNLATLLLDTMHIQTRSQPHQYTWSACTAPSLTQELQVCDETRISLTPASQTLSNLDNAGPIVRRPMDLPVAAGCDRAWARTQNLWWHS